MIKEILDFQKYLLSEFSVIINGRWSKGASHSVSDVIDPWKNKLINLVKVVAILFVTWCPSDTHPVFCHPVTKRCWNICLTFFASAPLQDRRKISIWPFLLLKRASVFSFWHPLNIAIGDICFPPHTHTHLAIVPSLKKMLSPSIMKCQRLAAVVTCMDRVTVGRWTLKRSGKNFIVPETQTGNRMAATFTDHYHEYSVFYC